MMWPVYVKTLIELHCAVRRRCYVGIYLLARCVCVLLLFLVACSSSPAPQPDAALDAPACHEVEASCPSGMHAMSCFVNGTCVFPGEPGAQDWVCCP